MSDSHDDASKTEEPTHKRLEDARKKGQVAQSREINHFFLILALTCVVMMLAPAMVRDIGRILGPYLTRPDQFQLNQGTLGETLKDTLGSIVVVMLLPTIVALMGVFATPTVQNKWIFTAEQIKPKFEKLSPLKGINRIYGGKALLEFAKNLIKVTVVALIVWYSAKPYFNYVDSLMGQSPLQSMLFVQTVAGKVLTAVCIALFALSVADFFIQKFIFMKSMRMTKQELKEEYKQQEGDPHIRAKLRQIRREKAQRRMMANVPRADVVITNPTHFAVALEYNPETMKAPKVVAKGADAVAAKIREIAEKHKIPVMRNPPLARILYDTTDIDEDIPFEHYAAVAKIIGFVYRMKGKSPAELKPKPKPKKPQSEVIWKRPQS